MAVGIAHHFDHARIVERRADRVAERLLQLADETRMGA
jgi:hypothetical protein